ncbi:BTB/POZ domain-containing protein [Sesamum angolense]|uniref:BTB/POZ domain-containing protein n=1 Tax=Sesamum angolense TaxID=2727404 RepID=A0AAE2BH14_9LAMI|nr:BTB/POZ domain-containing protein [Sesamum angolense]
MQSSTESDNNTCRIELRRTGIAAGVPVQRKSSQRKVEKHVYSLSIAADKYEIPFLQKFCEHHMLGSLNSSNALDVLEISDTCSNQSLKETALNFIVRNMEDIVFSARFDAFALKNPHLTVQITRASFMDIRNRRAGV